MEERFKQLFAIKEDLYTESSPVIIEKGILLLDTKSNKLLIQLKFCNIAEKPFKALYISFNTYDTSNVHLPFIEYKYLDIKVDYGKSFGADKAIILENNLVRSFEISKYSVVYEDNEIQTFSDPFLQLPDSDLLQTKFADEELIKQYCIETSKYSQYVPIQYKGIWKCACGKWNSKNICWNCKEIKGDIFGKLTDPRLITNKEARLEQERINKELQEKQRVQVEKEEQIKKKRIRNVIIAGSMLVVSGILYTSFVQPYITYQHGKKLLSEKKYDDAIAEFAKVDGYKDSKSMIDDSYYQKGASLLEEKKFDEAEEIFKDLDDLEMCREVQYQRALTFISEKEYSKAENIFRWLKNSNYKDSEEQFHEVKYQEGIRFMDAENYSSASAVFQNIKDYKDALSKWEECQYILGTQEISKKKYDKAIEYFEKIINSAVDKDKQKDASEKINECYYKKANLCINKGETDIARKILKGIENYQDSKELILDLDYEAAEEKMQNGDYEAALIIYKSLGRYKDTESKIELCNKKIATFDLQKIMSSCTKGMLMQTILDKYGNDGREILSHITNIRQYEYSIYYSNCYFADMIGTVDFKFEQINDGDQYNENTRNIDFGLKEISWELDCDSVSKKTMKKLRKKIIELFGNPSNEEKDFGKENASKSYAIQWRVVWNDKYVLSYSNDMIDFHMNF